MENPIRDSYGLALRTATGEFKMTYGFKDGQQRSTSNVHHNIKARAAALPRNPPHRAIRRGAACAAHCAGGEGGEGRGGPPIVEPDAPAAPLRTAP